jgi:hypothetical protein
MFARAEDGTVTVIVEKAEFRSPRNNHRKTGGKHDGDGRAQALGPDFDLTQRRLCPVNRAHQCAHFAAPGEEVGSCW